MRRNKNDSFKTKQTRKTQEPVCSAAGGVKSDPCEAKHITQPRRTQQQPNSDSVGREAFHSSADRGENLHKSNAFVATISVI